MKKKLRDTLCRSEEVARLLTAFHTIFPLSNGTTCVKLNPESIIIVHSGVDKPGTANKFPNGITDAAER
jgi:hypothetical protein